MGISDYASSWISEARVLYNLAVKPVTGDTHKERLESFYGDQAGDYDAFRKRLLTGREERAPEDEHAGRFHLCSAEFYGLLASGRGAAGAPP